MFGLFKRDPRKKLEEEYHQLLEKAMQAQRSGDIRLYSELSEQADGVHQQLKALDGSDEP